MDRETRPPTSRGAAHVPGRQRGMWTRWRSTRSGVMRAECRLERASSYRRIWQLPRGTSLDRAQRPPVRSLAAAWRRSPKGAAMSRPRLGISVAVGGLLAAATAGHVLYPAWLAWRTRGGRGKVAVAPGAAGPGASPDLTVVVPAYREAGRDRRQGRRPPGQRVPGITRDTGGGRRGSRDRGGGGAGRRPGSDRPGRVSASRRRSTGASPRPRRRSS